jgi:hypothetical protein
MFYLVSVLFQTNPPVKEASASKNEKKKKKKKKKKKS